MQRSAIPLTLALCVSFPILSCNEVGIGGSDTGPMFSHPDIESMGYDGCVNLQCRQVTCKNSKKTTLSGRINIPAGNLPIPGAYVYIPNAGLKSIAPGPSCERCDTLFSGEPVTKVQTDLDGKFVLDNVPTGDNVPLVVQVGKWRREVNVSYVEPCRETALPEENTRLPKTSAEGNIPKIALATGGADVLECLLRKLGIADSEFTTDTGNGRVNLYTGVTSGANRFDTTLNGGAMFTSARTLWGTAANLNKYDLFMGSCEGSMQPSNETAQSIQNVYDYVNAGGRVFASHWHSYWIRQQTNWNGMLTFNNRADIGNTTADISTNFGRGSTLASWLVQPSVGGSTMLGKLDLRDAQNTLQSVDTTRVQSWITVPASQNVQYVSFDTPSNAPASQKCGRFVLSDIHVSSGDMPNQPFPRGCTTTTLSPQEKALIFLLFDLSSCIEPPIG